MVPEDGFKLGRVLFAISFSFGFLFAQENIFIRLFELFENNSKNACSSRQVLYVSFLVHFLMPNVPTVTLH